MQPIMRDPRADARIDLLYKEFMDKLDEVDDKASEKYVKFPPKNYVAAKPVLLLSALPNAPPARNVA
jgi:hypothetical protein